VGALIILSVSDIVYDTQLGDVGILLRRKNGNTSVSYETFLELWVWDIFWISEGHTLYTENGLLNMIREERLLLFRST
jgi:hypothetical protein